jgi:tetratricopeptide (TPR) repeat protein
MAFASGCGRSSPSPVRLSVRASLFFTIALLSAGIARAQTLAENETTCVSPDFTAVTPDIRISACSAVIQSGQVTGQNLATAYLWRGIAYNEKNDFDSGIKDFNAALGLNPNFAGPYYDLGWAYDAKGDYDTAIKDCSKAIQLSPSADAYTSRAGAEFAKGDYAAAIQDETAAITLGPSDAAGVYGTRCFLRAITGDLKNALADCNQAFALLPGNPGATQYPRLHLFEDEQRRRGDRRL